MFHEAEKNNEKVIIALTITVSSMLLSSCDTMCCDDGKVIAVQREKPGLVQRVVIMHGGIKNITSITNLI